MRDFFESSSCYILQPSPELSDCQYHRYSQGSWDSPVCDSKAAVDEPFVDVKAFSCATGGDAAAVLILLSYLTFERAPI